MTDTDFAEGQLLGARLVAPWHVWLDERKFNANVGSLQSLPINVIASCHAPALAGRRIEQGFDVLRTVPSADAWAPYTQADLELWMSSMHAEG